MKDFRNIRFDGKFRDYQQGVLNRASKHLRDKKIHIVAAPGSGKTILGLELICRQKSPALVLSPSVTIRQQWGERFAEKFLPKGENTADYVSFDLKAPQLITSITYQALHAAVTKQTLEAEESAEEVMAEQSEDFSDFNIFEFIRSMGIKTICLDEAHHLKSEWQKALELFISKIQSDVTVISLTATPPYDTTLGDWNRYITLCGEIDEEIFVPQLVAQKTLCPHQDFVYFSYPTADEAELLRQYKIKGVRTAEEILKGQLMDDILAASVTCNNGAKLEEIVLQNTKSYTALLVCAEYAQKQVPAKLLKIAGSSGVLPQYNIQDAQTAFQFVIENPDCFSEEVSEKLRSTLAGNGLIDKKKVCLVSDEKLNRQLASSTGKLSGINDIVLSEKKNLGDKLRMLILTDYIKRDMMKLVGTDEEITSMGTVPVFESVRRACGDKVKLAMLSGTIVVVPNESVEEIGKIATSMDVNFRVKEVAQTAYSEIVFSGSNKNKVSVITAAFQKGLINVLIGTKSLLGEGWDSPCINSLILASFVGSFVLSNQMRGRAIRTDRNDPEKVSNIWHLVTVEPIVEGENEEEKQLFEKVLCNDSSIYSDDFDTLKRRFNGFLAPAYHSEIVESGMDRIDIINAPFDKAGFENIDSQMLAIAADRRGMADHWIKSLHGSKVPEVLDVVEVKKPSVPKKYTFNNMVKEVALFVVWLILLIVKIKVEIDGFLGGLLSVVWFAAFAVVTFFVIKGLVRILNTRNAEKMILTISKCIFKTLKGMKEVESTAKSLATLPVAPDKNNDIYVMLSGPTVHEKKVFSAALSEMLSAVDNPRYVIVKKNRFGMDYSHCYACPAIIGTKKENVQLLTKHLKSSIGEFELFYTKNDEGRAHLLRCRQKSYINASGTTVAVKKVAK
ncbi:MAG: DEAD/DEAH box helicase family protein [Clostridia bacterium]|nr:DEAD/DEAH box helicase family protein [Clostridia bacterium]